MTIISWIMLALAIIILVRNQWVHHQRTLKNRKWYEIMCETVELDEQIPYNEDGSIVWWNQHYRSYSDMMWRVWCWDIEKMRK